MSSHINDLHSSAEVQASVYPSTVTATGPGSEVDFATADGPCFAVQMIGDMVDNTTLDGSIEESAEGTAWSAIPDAAFDQIAEANNVQVISFQRTKRYVRWTATIAGTSPSFDVAILIGEQRKTF
jgi:hypothetical protein